MRSAEMVCESDEAALEVVMVLDMARMSNKAEREVGC
jgi:hypothetical protein